METDDEAMVQTPLETCHTKLFVPVEMAVTLVVAAFEFATTAEPELVQEPLPKANGAATNCAVALQIVCKLPALEIGNASR